MLDPHSVHGLRTIRSKVLVEVCLPPNPWGWADRDLYSQTLSILELWLNSPNRSHFSLLRIWLGAKYFEV